MTQHTGKHKGTRYKLEAKDDKSCTLTRQSPFGGELTKVLPVPAEEVKAYYDGQSGLIQQAFPGLSVDDREFIMTGIPPEQWPS